MNSEDKKTLKSVVTPSYVLDTRLLRKNLELLKSVQDRTGAKILLALKGFSMHSVFPIVGEYLTGITSSSLFEAKLGKEYMDKEVHIYAPAYRDDEFDEILEITDHIVFNSMDQYRRFEKKMSDYNKERLSEDNVDGKSLHKKIECGLRVNPEYSEVATEIYNPCAINSRLGTKLDQLKDEDFEVFDGLHFHTMCEQNSDTLERTLAAVEEKFGKYLYGMKWLNFGGGHHITREDYDVERLIKLINHIQDKYDVQVYLEPGEAIPLNCGYLVATVLDVVKNGMEVAILDTSAACHMPDVIEMPYRPYVVDSGMPNEKAYTYRFGGMTCLAGDVIGDYSFDEPLQIGDQLIFTDMGHYTMVKNNMFNGVNLPSIALMDENGVKVLREFTYEDYKTRLS